MFCDGLLAVSGNLLIRVFAGVTSVSGFILRNPMRQGYKIAIAGVVSGFAAIGISEVLGYYRVAWEWVPYLAGLFLIVGFGLSSPMLPLYYGFIADPANQKIGKLPPDQRLPAPRFCTWCQAKNPASSGVCEVCGRPLTIPPSADLGL